MSHHLSLMLLIPLAGAVTLGAWGERPTMAARRVALGFALASVVGATSLWLIYDSASTSYQFVERVRAIPAIGADYHVGLDGLSLLLMFLTTLIVGAAVAWSSVSREADDRVGPAWIFALEFGLLTTFLALDLLVLLAGWATTLVAAHRVAHRWRARAGTGTIVSASIALSVISGLALCVGVLGLASAHHQIAGQYSFDITAYQQLGFDPDTQRWVFLVFLTAFAACVALVLPASGLLPVDRTASSVVGVVLVGAVVVKMGTYGLLRISLPILPDATRAFLPLTVGMGALAMLAGGVLAVARKDWLVSMAYASAGQLAMMMLGAFASNPVGVTGSALQQFNHGVAFAALWLLVASIRHRDGDTASAVSRTLYAAAVVVALGAIGVPMASGFVGTFLIIQSLLTISPLWSVAAVAGVALSAAALMRVIRDIPLRFGGRASPGVHAGRGLRRVEWLAVAPLVALTVWVGVYPSPMLERLTTGVDRIVARVAPEYGQHAIAECGAAPTPELAKTNAAAAFLQSVPCGPDGKPLEQPAEGQSQSR